MPPKRKPDKLVQTKLAFFTKPPSTSSQDPVTVSGVVPLKTDVGNIVHTKSTSQLQSSHQPTKTSVLFGGNGHSSGARYVSSENTRSTKDQTRSSISAHQPASLPSPTSLTGNHRSCEVSGNISHHKQVSVSAESPLDGDEGSSAKAPSPEHHPDMESRKRKAADGMELDDEFRKRMDIGSNSEDEEVFEMTEESRNMHLSNSSTFPPSSAPVSSSLSSSTTEAKPTPQPSLMDLMATPKGTLSMPRTHPKAMVGYNAATRAASESNMNRNSSSASNGFGRSSSQPSLTQSSMPVSDDGFDSGSKLDSLMQSLPSSQEPEVKPPVSNNPLKDVLQREAQKQQQQQQQQRSYYQSTYKSFSQKGSTDFTALSKGGTKRTLPPTVTKPAPTTATTATSGYQAVSNFNVNNAPKPFKDHKLSLARSSSFQKSKTTERTESPSSSQGSPSGRGGVDYPQNMTRDGMILSDEQLHVLDQVLTYQRNVFFTGSAGTGKSVLLRELIHRLRSKYKGDKREFWESSNDSVAVTASTGIAACNIGGCTLHSFAGVGLGTESLTVLQGKARRNNVVTRRWQDTKVLIVDEVSMVDADFMDKLEALARSIRKDDRPWGGMQIVLTGDFFQLPPINKGGNVKFCFEGESWARTINLTIQLQQVFRQKDQTFANMLNDMRLGQLSPATVEQFRSLTRDLVTGDGLRATELFPLRNQVDEANNRMLGNLSGVTKVYHARDRGPLKEKMEQNCLAPTTLQLKVGAQVMLLRNQAGGAGGLVNGSLGVLTAFVTKPADNDQFGSSGERKGTLNEAGEELPLVRFTLEGGVVRDMVVGREEWKIELPNGEVQGARVQIPLGLAWSLSIHKSQGQTLPKVRVDLGKVFEKGQAYVALSRATSLEGLQVLNFDPRKVMVHPKVTEFYNQLRVYKTPSIR